MGLICLGSIPVGIVSARQRPETDKLGMRVDLGALPGRGELGPHPGGRGDLGPMPLPPSGPLVSGLPSK